VPARDGAPTCITSGPERAAFFPQLAAQPVLLRRRKTVQKCAFLGQHL
jgi:hypothetical protein